MLLNESSPRNMLGDFMGLFVTFGVDQPGRVV